VTYPANYPKDPYKGGTVYTLFRDGSAIYNMPDGSTVTQKVAGKSRNHHRQEWPLVHYLSWEKRLFSRHLLREWNDYNYIPRR